jgi:hypothetical protein
VLIKEAMIVLLIIDKVSEIALLHRQLVG